jgi:hypothetical protein
MHHLKVSNLDAAENASTAVIRVMEIADENAGEAFSLSHVHAVIEGVSDAFNSVIINQGSLLMSNCILLNRSGGSGVSNGLYSTGVNTYARVSDSLIKVYNASGSSVKNNVYAAGATTVEVYNSRITQSTDNGDGIALYANGNGTWIYAFGSSVYGKTHSAKEVSGDITFFGGRMTNNEGAGVTCQGMRSWVGNDALSSSCD